MKIVKLSKFLLILIMLFQILSCTKASVEKKNLNITTSFYPIYIFTLNIAKDVPDVKINNLTKPATGCLHDYSLTPEDMKVLETTNILIINGGGMESFLGKAVSLLSEDKIIDSSAKIKPIVANGVTNPHFWVSISNAITQVENISSKLQQLDPIHKKQYQANTEQYIVRLTELKTKMHMELAEIKNRDIITFHEAFPYFAKEFDLNIITVIEREPGSQPSAGELSRTIDLIHKTKVKAIFAEPQYPAKSAETIGKETKLKIYTLDPGVTGSIQIDAYEKIMESNLAVLKEALR